MPYFSHSVKRQLANPFKVFGIDTGLRNATGFRFSNDIGRMYENVVAIDLKRRGNEIYYWKNPQHEEVDFVIREGKAEKTLLLVWSAIMLAATWSENRFAYYFAVNASLLTGFLAWQVWELAAARLLPLLPGGSAVGAMEVVAAAKHPVTEAPLST